ncbi:uncharacterized protein PHACADRAFT_60574, partial [Phanerochaete carnosa HHB-10118-sp]
RPPVFVISFICDIANFLDEQPGGRHLLVKYVGEDAATAFFAGVYDHTNTVRNV